MEKEDNNVIKIDFSKPLPDEAFRSTMVDVFKNYFTTSSVEGLPNSVSVECILNALSQAVGEMDNVSNIYWRETVIRFVEERFGVRLMEPEDFEELRKKVSQFDEV